MGLLNVVGTKPVSGEAPKSRYVGMKLKNEDADELAGWLGFEKGLGGAEIFKGMIEKIAKHTVDKDGNSNWKEPEPKA